MYNRGWSGAVIATATGNFERQMSTMDGSRGVGDQHRPGSEHGKTGQREDRSRGARHRTRPETWQALLNVAPSSLGLVCPRGARHYHCAVSTPAAPRRSRRRLGATAVAVFVALIGLLGAMIQAGWIPPPGDWFSPDRPLATGPACDRPICLDPASGRAGSLVIVHGVGFAPDENVALRLGDDDIGSAHTDAAGSFAASVSVPGAYAVRGRVELTVGERIATGHPEQERSGAAQPRCRSGRRGRDEHRWEGRGAGGDRGADEQVPAVHGGTGHHTSSLSLHTPVKGTRVQVSVPCGLTVTRR
jgi:hypothetical protein